MPVAAIGAAVSAAGSIASGIIGANAANRAGQLAQQAAQQGNKLIGNQMTANSGYLDPFVTGGQTDFAGLNALLNGDSSAFDRFRNSTNYQFMLNQGLQGVEYANAPAFSSGATAKALNNYAQGMAGNALAGYEQMLLGGAQLGENAGGVLGQLNTQGAEQQSANLLSAAGVQGSAGMAAANALGGAIRGGVSALGNVLGAFSPTQSSISMPAQSTSGFYNPGALQTGTSFDFSGLSDAVPALG